MNPCDIKAIFTSYVSLPEGNPSKGEDSKQVIPFERSNLRIMKTAREQPRKLGFIQKGMETLRNFAIFRYILISFSQPMPPLTWALVTPLMDGVREVQLGAKDSLSHPLMAKSCRKERRVMIFSCGCSWLWPANGLRF